MFLHRREFDNRCAAFLKKSCQLGNRSCARLLDRFAYSIGMMFGTSTWAGPPCAQKPLWPQTLHAKWTRAGGWHVAKFGLETLDFAKVSGLVFSLAIKPPQQPVQEVSKPRGLMTPWSVTRGCRQDVRMTARTIPADVGDVDFSM